MLKTGCGYDDPAPGRGEVKPAPWAVTPQISNLRASSREARAEEPSPSARDVHKSITTNLEKEI